jgi:short-subunit dehydrogenase involved in D-alanine esterification of teichoic acids
MRPGFVGNTGLIIGGSSSIRKAVGTLQHEKRVEAVVIMGKNQKKLLVAKSLQREAFRPSGIL